MSIKWFNRKVLTGGGVTALDAVLSLSGDADSMAEDGDRAFVYTADGLFYTLEFEYGATDAEAAPLIIRADDGGGVWRLKRWSDSAPVGVPYLWLTDTAPAQHMFVYGQGLSTTVYPELFAVLGYTFGGSGGTFYLPTPQGRFPRFTDNGAGIDTDASTRTSRGDGTTGDAVGTLQGCYTKRPNTSFTTNTDSHSHTYNKITDTTAVDNEVYSKTVLQGDGTTTNTSSDSHSHTINGGGDNQTCPANMNFNLIIKYE
jgi:microcystin-dependent protein